MVKTGDILLIVTDDAELRCRLETIDEGGTVVTVLEPANTFRIGKMYSLSAPRSDGVLVASGKVEKAVKAADEKTGALAFTFQLKEPFHKIQKRNYVRHDCYLQTTFFQKDEPNEVFQGHILNISARGAKVVSNSHIFANSTIFLQTTLNKVHLLVEALVLETVKQDASTNIYKYGMRMQFLNISPREEEKVIKYIFEEYRKKKAMGK